MGIAVGLVAGVLSSLPAIVVERSFARIVIAGTLGAAGLGFLASCTCIAPGLGG